MRILVCDDEQRYCQIINEYILANFDENSEGVIEIFNSAKELVEFCLKNEPDVLFLDIELGDINGIEVAKYLRNEFPTLIIVYITNHPDYVFSCFETEPLNFLKKPIDKIEFDKTFQRIIKKYTEIHKCIPIKWQNDSVNLEIKDICYIEGYNRHLVFICIMGKAMKWLAKLMKYITFLKYMVS